MDKQNIDIDKNYPYLIVKDNNTKKLNIRPSF